MLKGQNDTDVCLKFVEAFSLKFLILTAGAEYSTIFTPDDLSHIKTPKVTVVDTVGAGDSFTALLYLPSFKIKRLPKRIKQRWTRLRLSVPRPGRGCNGLLFHQLFLSLLLCIKTQLKYKKLLNHGYIHSYKSSA